MAAVRAVVLEARQQQPLGRLAQPEPIEQVRGGEPVKRAQPDGHAPLRDLLLGRHAGANNRDVDIIWCHHQRTPMAVGVLLMGPLRRGRHP